MHFEIKNRYTGKVSFTAEIECADDATSAIKIGLAVKWALKSADLQDAYLRDADLRGAYLGDADLRGADLRGAYLQGAYLGGADLRGADLGGAYLQDAWIIQGPIRSDGYAFLLQKLKGDTEPMVRAGCRYLTIPAARAHWTKTRGGTPLGDETFAILDYLARVAAIRNLIPQKAERAA